MNIDNEELLQRTYALVKENNKLLKKARHSAWIGTFFKLLFWGAMIGVPLWLYFTVLQPVLTQGVAAMNQMQGLVGQAQGVSGAADGAMGQVQSLFNSLPGLDALKQLKQ